MGHSNPSEKGGAFERRCGRDLSLWLTGGADRSQLIRSQSSGGWKYRNVNHVGDLAPNGPAGEEFRSVFGVECKDREEFEWRHLWTSANPALCKWWLKHQGECAEHNLAPMLLLKRNREPLLVVLPPDLLPWWAPERALLIERRDLGVTLLLAPWEDFAKLDPQDVLEAARTWIIPDES